MATGGGVNASAIHWNVAARTFRQTKIGNGGGSLQSAKRLASECTFGVTRWKVAAARTTPKTTTKMEVELGMVVIIVDREDEDRQMVGSCWMKNIWSEYFFWWPATTCYKPKAWQWMKFWVVSVSRHIYFLVQYCTVLNPQIDLPGHDLTDVGRRTGGDTTGKNGVLAATEKKISRRQEKKSATVLLCNCEYI